MENKDLLIKQNAPIIRGEQSTVTPPKLEKNLYKLNMAELDMVTGADRLWRKNRRDNGDG